MLQWLSDPWHVVFVIAVIALIGITAKILHYDHFAKWYCEDCGKAQRGHSHYDGFRYYSFGPCCNVPALDPLKFRRNASNYIQRYRPQGLKGPFYVEE